MIFPGRVRDYNREMSPTEFQLETLGIVGVGLIGGSIAAAARKRGLAQRVIGYGRNRQRLEQARSRGLIDDIAPRAEDLGSCRLIVVCTPVDRLGSDLREMLTLSSPSTLVTDVGSVKGPVVDQVIASAPDPHRYIPAHPIAGSHLQGFEHADADLCADRLCLLTPLPQNAPADIALVSDFWKAIGMRVSTMSVEEHDRVLALTSHLPHLAASAVAAMIEESLLEYAGTGYRDTTRVAAGDPDLWTAIFTENAVALARSTRQLIQTLDSFLSALESGNHADIRDLLQQGRQRRSHFHREQSDE